MKLQKSHTEMVRACISSQERIGANELAKSRGMTFQGWLGQLIRRELDHESYSQTGETAKG